MPLFSRSKKMRFDPDARYKVGRQVTKRAEEIFLTRRLLVARGAVVAGFSLLATRLGYMQIVKGRYYQDEARANTEEIRTLKPPRGLIYDTHARILADNKKTWEVRVVPAYLPVDETDRRHVIDQVISALVLPDALVLDPNAIPGGSEDLVHNQLVGTMVALGMFGEASAPGVIEYLQIESTRNYLVLVDESLTIDEAAQFRALAGKLPGVAVMNYLDYLIGNAGPGEIPIPVKTGVPKEIALKLEANRNSLPGFELDDSVLVRRYHGGQVMSHILGYARRITEKLYEDRKNDVDDAGHLIYEPDDVVGQDGIEFTLEPELRGKKGQQWVQLDGRRVIMREISRTEPTPGNSVKLTLDLELQEAASTILSQAIQFANEDRRAKNTPFQLPATSGAIVAIDPNNGNVLAMVSYPHYDNQLFVDGISRRQYDAYNDKAVGAPLLNRAIAGQFPSGSTIKPFMATTALRDKIISTETRFTCHGGITIPYDWDVSRGTDHPCWARVGGHGELDVYGGIEQSCDVFFYNVGAPKDKLPGAKDYLHYYDQGYDADGKKVQRGEKHYFEGLGIEPMHRGLTKRFWFGQDTKIDLPGELPGVIPNPAYVEENFVDVNWSVSATCNVSIGQGYLQVTPLQLALNTAAIANNGRIWQPRLIEEILKPDGHRLKKPKAKLLREMKIKPEHFDIVREGMRRVVHSSTGSANHSLINGREVTKWPKTNPEGEDEIIIGGKTGTAEIGEPDEKTGKYLRQHAWFTCFAPFDTPEIALSVVIEEGGEGSSYAVPVADRVLRCFFETTGRRKRGVMLKKDGEGLVEDNRDDILPAPGTTQDTVQD